MNVRTLRPIKFGRLGEEIDRKDLLDVVRRFQNVHKRQLERIQRSLTRRQRDFLELLPLLFHTNHPLLPGFVSTETPAGITDFTPGRQAIQSALRISKSFEYRRRALSDYPVLGIFLMGSVGSIAYSRYSDLDIWLCHAPELDPAALDELRQKAGAIESWASTLGLEVHIFFINPEDFRRGIGEPISTESCGSVQHHLLLEEFYRTSLYIAGRTPAWWLVPPEEDLAYTAYLHHLQDKRFIQPDDIIDFGGLESVSAEEFLGGTLWHLFKAISSPHKSLLKLMLMESYSQEFPQPEWLCTRLKAAVHAGVTDVYELDSYILMYRKVEMYLRARKEFSRLELARQCFYLKINESLSAPDRAGPDSLERRQQLRNTIEHWGWGDERLSELDERRRWRIAQVLEEQQRINRELTSSYQSVSRFAKDHAHDLKVQANEIRLLGRRLFAALEKKPGKVEIVSSDGYDELVHEDFSLHEAQLADGEQGWLIFPGKVKLTDKHPPPPLKRAHSLIEILAWLALNGFYSKTTQLLLETSESNLSTVELRSIVGALSGFLDRQEGDEDSLEAYGSAARLKSCALFVNVGHDSEAARKDGLQVASSRFDPLSFGASRVNLIHGVDQIVRTSWRETLVQQYRDVPGLFDCLCEILNQGSSADPPTVEVLSFSSIRSRSIALRVESLYRGLLASFEAGAPAFYVVRGGSEFFIFDKPRGVVRHRKFADQAGLTAELAKPRPEFTAVRFDPLALEASPLPAIFERNRAGVVQVFFMVMGERSEIFILDERGSLFGKSHVHGLPKHLLAAYDGFFGAIQQRYVLPVLQVEFMMVTSSSSGQYQFARLPLSLASPDRQLQVRVHGHEQAPGEHSCTIYCNEEEFSSLISGTDVYGQAAEYIRRQRRGGEEYPVHVSDIDVPLGAIGVDSPEQLQTIHLLNYKELIEHRLND